MASEATKMAIPGTVHIQSRVTEVSLMKSEVKSDLEGQ